MDRSTKWTALLSLPSRWRAMTAVADRKFSHAPPASPFADDIDARAFGEDADTARIASWGRHVDEALAASSDDRDKTGYAILYN